MWYLKVFVIGCASTSFIALLYFAAVIVLQKLSKQEASRATASSDAASMKAGFRSAIRRWRRNLWRLRERDTPSYRSPSLWLKSQIINTQIEETARQIRWRLGAARRARHPELWELALEERRFPQVLQKLLTPGSSGIDVGAHLGSFLSLLIRIAPNGRHTAIEPIAVKCRWLRSRFPNVTVIEAAASDRNGTAAFEECVRRSGYSRLADESSVFSGNRYEVATIRLDDLELPHVDFLKIDVEGNELLVLRGADQLIKAFRPSILFESGPIVPGRQVDRDALFHHLTGNLRYHVYCFTDFLFDGRGPMTHDEFRKAGVYPFRAFNYVALPPML
jgi:FkbM family methyltransferase